MQQISISFTNGEKWKVRDVKGTEETPTIEYSVEYKEGVLRVIKFILDGTCAMRQQIALIAPLSRIVHVSIQEFSDTPK